LLALARPTHRRHLDSRHGRRTTHVSAGSLHPADLQARNRNADMTHGADHEVRRRRHITRLESLLPDYVNRVDWPADQIWRERDRALRVLLGTAVDRSPWHRERLAGINPVRASETDLPSLPVMTKADLMDSFDDIVTDRRITRDLCEDHLAGAAAGDTYLLGEYHVVASGGSSGRRAVFVYGWDAWAICWASMIRFPMRDWASDAALAGLNRVAAVVAAAKPMHVSAAFRHRFSTPHTPEHVIPISQPLEHIVAELNQLQPTELIGFSSMLPLLAKEAERGGCALSRAGCWASPSRCSPRPARQSERPGMSQSVLGTGCRRVVHRILRAGEPPA
jgi:phenylacetate-CoA ligase